MLDEEPLLTPHLLKLTRWMADYYVCGWGQVLNAVLPSGVKQQAGTRAVPLIELIPENPDFQTIVVPTTGSDIEFELEGLAVGLIRNNMLM